MADSSITNLLSGSNLKTSDMKASHLQDMLDMTRPIPDPTVLTGSITPHYQDASWGSGIIVTNDLYGDGLTTRFVLDRSNGTDPSYLEKGWEWIESEDVDNILCKWIGARSSGQSIDMYWTDTEWVETDDAITFGNDPKVKIKPNRALIVGGCDVTEGDQIVVRILPSGRVMLKPGLALDETARKFWVTVAGMSPGVTIGALKKLQDAVQEVLELCDCDGKCEKCQLLLANVPKRRLDIEELFTELPDDQPRITRQPMNFYTLPRPEGT